MSVFNPKPEHIEFYRVSTVADVCYVLRRKKCNCGRTVTDKQLAQYCKCEQCLKENK